MHGARSYLACQFCLIVMSYLIISNIQSENEKLRSEIQSHRSREEKYTQEINTLKGRLYEVSKQKTHMARDLGDLQAKHEDLISQQKDD